MTTSENPKKLFAEVSWCIDDVHYWRNDHGYDEWTDADAEFWLEQNAKDIADYMIEKGWEVFEYRMGEGNE